MAIFNSGHLDEEELLQLEDMFEEDSSDEVQYFSSNFTVTDFEHEMNSADLLESDTQVEKEGKKCLFLSNMARIAIVQKLLAAAKDQDILLLPKGIINETATEYNCSRKSVSKLWHDAKLQKKSGEVINANNKKRGRVRRKCKDINEDVLLSVPLHKRTTIRSYATSLQVSPSLVYSLLNRGKIRTHSNSIKPKLTPSHKEQRLLWVLRHIIPRTLDRKVVFEGLYNYVHIDEKWFYMNKKTMKFYLLPKEEDPYRSTQSKNYILKVIFLATVARPILNKVGEVIWDGKIGVFLFTEVVVAQRSSSNSNRARGTPEVKAIQKITREVIKQKLISEMLPCIKAKWPTNAPRQDFDSTRQCKTTCSIK